MNPTERAAFREPERKFRLADALRENLKRRKQQARARAARQDEPSSAPSDPRFR